MRVAGVSGEGGLAGDDAEFGPYFLEALDGFPEALGGVGLAAEGLDEVEGHVEFVADLAAELDGGVRDGEEEHRERGGQEVVECLLLFAVDVGGFVEAGQDADGVFADVDGCLGEVFVLHYLCGGHEDGAVDEDAHLVGAEVEDHLETTLAAVGGSHLCEAFGVESEALRNGVVPLQNLVIQNLDVFLVDFTTRTVEAIGSLPDFGRDTTIGYHCC